MPREGLAGSLHDDLHSGIQDADVVICLRLQKERMASALLPSEAEFHRDFGMTMQRLAWAAPDAIVMHPGPINRGVEIDSELADSERSVILQQVTNGIAVRMAVLSMVMGVEMPAELKNTGLVDLCTRLARILRPPPRQPKT